MHRFVSFAVSDRLRLLLKEVVAKNTYMCTLRGRAFSWSLITEKYSGIEKHHTMDDGPRLRNERSKSEKEQLRCKVFLTNASSPIRIAEMEAEGGESSAHIDVFEWSAKETEVEARIQN